MSTHAVIIGHGKRQDIFDQHLPIWKAMGLPLFVFSPTDDPIATSERSINFGVSSLAGEHSASRWWFLLTEIAFNYVADTYIFFEYDSIFLGNNPPEISNGFHGGLETNKEPERYMAPRYLGAPWTLNYSSLEAMRQVAAMYPDLIEEGQVDRMLAAWAMIANVPILPHREPAIFENTLSVELLEKKYAGINPPPKWIHGIKDRQTLDWILNKWKS